MNLKNIYVQVALYLCYIFCSSLWIEGFSLPETNAVQYFAHGRLQIVGTDSGKGPYKFICGRINMTFSNDVLGYKQIGHKIYIIGTDTTGVVHYHWGGIATDEYTLLPTNGKWLDGWQKIAKAQRYKMEVISSFDEFSKKDKQVFRNILAGHRDEHGLLTY